MVCAGGDHETWQKGENQLLKLEADSPAILVKDRWDSSGKREVLRDREQQRLKSEDSSDKAIAAELIRAETNNAADGETVVAVEDATDVPPSPEKAFSSSDSPKKVCVELQLPKKVKYGTSACVVGSTASLGAWDALKAPQMEWTEGDVWRSTLEVEPG